MLTEGITHKGADKCHEIYQNSNSGSYHQTE